MSDVNPIKRIKAESLRAQVYAQLKEQLTRGAWEPGEKLPPELELCRLFGVSRVTVRAAIQQLEILGLVEVRHGDGTFVKDFSAIDKVDAFHPFIQIKKNRDLITVLEYRKIIEKGTIGLAQEKISRDDIAFLEKTYRIMVNAADDMEAYTRADLDFHYRIAEITGNSIIVKVYALLNEILSAAMEDIVRLLGRNIGLTYHKKIIEALKKGDKPKSEALMEEHIEKTIKALEKKEQSDSAGA
jgi:GntR family transcriptional repressor for pyruvate dehydrogenase complex